MTSECTCVAVFSDGLATQHPGSGLWKASGFDGGTGQTLLVAGGSGPVLLVGMGNRQEATAASLREAAALCGRSLAHLRPLRWDFKGLDVAGLTSGEAVQAIAEGVHLGAYRYGAGPEESSASPWQRPEGELGGVWARGEDIARVTNYVRDLVNEPANVLTPAELANRCRGAAADAGLQVRVLEEEELRRGRFGGIVAVGQGSVERPRLIELTHRGSGGRVDLSLVGKGVTFDSGGLSLKNSEGLMSMKQDMAGAAAVLGAMRLVRKLAPGLHVKAYLPLVENMPGPAAVKPGDVVTMRNGSTVEILNTDFEGRLILADALALAAEENPRAIVDLATLTYAAVHALGDRTAALLSNDKQLGEAIVSAAAEAGEPVWPMPLPVYLEEQLRSTVADYSNFPGSATARTLTAGLFLKAFVPPGIPWAHLDIAGPAWAAAGYGVTPAGATGYGVRLLATLLARLDSERTRPSADAVALNAIPGMSSATC